MGKLSTALLASLPCFQASALGLGSGSFAVEADIVLYALENALMRFENSLSSLYLEVLTRVSALIGEMVFYFGCR